jgi:hypothetical protein
MTVDAVYRIMRFIARKNQLESLSPSEFQDAFNTAQRNYYDFLVGRVEQYRYDKAVPRVGLAMTDNVVSRLMPFQMSASVLVTTGSAPKPLDFNKLLSMITANNYSMQRFEENRVADRLQDSIDPVAEANAFFVENSNSWSIYPTTLTSVKIKYLKLPVDVIWGYTIDGSGRPVYSPGTSVNPQWMDNDIDEIIARACKILGISIKENALVTYGQGVINTGE